MRAFLRILIPCLLMAALLAAAKYMDTGRYEKPVETIPEDPTLAVVETITTEPAPTAATIPLPSATEPAPEETLPEEIASPEPAGNQDRFLLTFAGDCTFGANANNYYAQLGFVKTIGDDYGYPFRNVLSYMENDDFTMVNLEGPLCDDGYPTNGNHVFHGPTAYVNILSQNSVEAVSLANDHTDDYGVAGYDTTCSVLNDAYISYVETDSSQIVTLESGLTIGLYATNYIKVDKDALVAQITALKEQAVDLIIYVPHWGVEGSYRPTNEQTELAHLAIDSGANIVYGTHPHVLQPVEEYNGGVIFYSLGNFSYGGNSSPKDLDTAIIQQEVHFQADGTIQLGERTLIPCSISSQGGINNYQPTPYSLDSAEYNRAMSKLDGTFTGPNLTAG